jgi:hypothetical protein
MPQPPVTGPSGPPTLSGPSALYPGNIVNLAPPGNIAGGSQNFIMIRPSDWIVAFVGALPVGIVENATAAFTITNPLSGGPASASGPYLFIEIYDPTLLTVYYRCGWKVAAGLTSFFACISGTTWAMNLWYANIPFTPIEVFAGPPNQLGGLAPILGGWRMGTITYSAKKNIAFTPNLTTPTSGVTGSTPVVSGVTYAPIVPPSIPGQGGQGLNQGLNINQN